MKVLLNRVWHDLLSIPRREGPPQESMTFAVRARDLQELRDMVAAAPGISLEGSGPVVATCVLRGSPEAVQAFAPKLRDWQHACEASDAW